MVRAFVAIGSNIDPAGNVRAALRSLARQTQLVGISTVYRTAPLDRPEQPPYYNCVAEIETTLPPLEVKRSLLRPIEDALGRRRSADKYASRTIDLDLIVYGSVNMEVGGLKLPDPEIRERPFLAIPLFELAPELVLAGHQRRIAEIASALGRNGMEPLTQYTRLLKEELGQGK